MRLEGRLICGMDIAHAVIDFGPIGTYINKNDYYTKAETDSLLDNKQDDLVSGTNIKTVGGESLLVTSPFDTDISPQYEFVATVDAVTGEVTCDETYESMHRLHHSGKTIVANVDGRLFYLESISGEGATLVNHDNGKLRELSLVYDEGQTSWKWVLVCMAAKPFVVTITENGGTFTADKTFAEVDAALTNGQLVRFFDGWSYFDVTGHIATMTIVASCTAGAANETFTFTPSGLTWKRTFLQVRTSGTRTERNNHSPVNLELYYDTTLNKLLICTDAQNRIWKDTMGNTV